MAHRLTAVLVLALMTAVGAAAQSTSPTQNEDQPKGDQSSKVTGTVVSSDNNRLVVRDDKGNQMTFIVNASTEAPQVYRVGDRVTASYVTLAGTGVVVNKIVPYVVTTTTTTPTTTTWVAPAETTTTTVKETTATTTAPAATTTTTYTAPSTATTYTAPATTPTENASVSSLPSTASSFPLIGLIGLSAAAGAVAIRRLHSS